MPTHTVTRQTIITHLTQTLRNPPFILAAWLGGSDGTNRTDALSDIDLQVLVEDDRVPETLDLLKTSLAELSPIAHYYRLPPPTWHGHEQFFLSLKDAAPCHFLDVLIIKHSAEDHFLDQERHGEPLVLLDRADYTTPTHTDRDAHLARMQTRLATLRETFPLFQHFIPKAATRGHHADAIGSYHSHTIRPLVELLRMRYAPYLFDYGLRYLDRDLPQDLQAEIQNLVFPPNLALLESYRSRAEAIFNEHLRALESGEWRLELPG